MKKFLAVFMAALMTISVFAGTARASQSVKSPQTSLVSTVEISDNALGEIYGGGYGSCAVAGFALTFGVVTGGLGFGVGLVIGSFAMTECVGKLMS